MQINKGNILKSIESFIGADNELAIKEAEHQIKVFEVVFQKEVESFQERENEDEKNINLGILKNLHYWTLNLQDHFLSHMTNNQKSSLKFLIYNCLIYQMLK